MLVKVKDHSQTIEDITTEDDIVAAFGTEDMKINITDRPILEELGEDN